MTNENQPAYPCGSGDMRDPLDLTRLELVAAMAMQGMLSNQGIIDIYPSEKTKIPAEAVKVARALLAACQEVQK